VPKAPDDLTADEEPLDGTEQMPLEMHLPDPDQPVPQAESAAISETEEGENGN
jgi:hypothetical protein